VNLGSSSEPSAGRSAWNSARAFTAQFLARPRCCVERKHVPVRWAARTKLGAGARRRSVLELEASYDDPSPLKLILASRPVGTVA
jgi:hypothetical protein